MSNDMKELIANTLLDMLKDDGLDNITISSLVEKCHISRQSFYYHFKDIFGVVAYIVRKNIIELKNECFHIPDKYASIHIFSMGVCRRAAVAKTLLNTKHHYEIESIILDEFKQFMDRVFLSPSLVGMLTDDERRIYAEFWACGLTKYLVVKTASGTLDAQELTEFITSAMRRLSESTIRRPKNGEDVSSQIIRA
ncbi:MAG: TetR family transcriptional regulator [Firmicutes bacterium]|nr:TetR family transcriptional regulator [Bacillota bacterium]